MLFLLAVPAVQGRTRYLVERRERLQAFDITPDTIPYSKQVKAKKSTLLVRFCASFYVFFYYYAYQASYMEGSRTRRIIALRFMLMVL